MPPVQPESSTVLVTGGTGYVGAWVVKYLLDYGFAVKLAYAPLDIVALLSFDSHVDLANKRSRRRCSGVLQDLNAVLQEQNRPYRRCGHY